jgi:hypothetical protein
VQNFAQKLSPKIPIFCAIRRLQSAFACGKIHSESERDERQTVTANFSKIFQKPLDKPLKMCYNKYRKQGNVP